MDDDKAFYKRKLFILELLFRVNGEKKTFRILSLWKTMDFFVNNFSRETKFFNLFKVPEIVAILLKKWELHATHEVNLSRWDFISCWKLLAGKKSSFKRFCSLLLFKNLRSKFFTWIFVFVLYCGLYNLHVNRPNQIFLILCISIKPISINSSKLKCPSIISHKYFSF